MNSAVSSIVQDPDGYLWFGSQAGLHRYNGYSMDITSTVPFSDEGLNHHLVQTLYMSDQDSLWIGTYGGINVLHLSDYSIDSFSTTAEVVTAIAQDSQARFWAGTLNGLELLDLDDGAHLRFLHDPENPLSLPESTVRALYLDSQGRFWIGSYGGLSLLVDDADEPSGYHFKNYDVTDGLSSPFVMAIDEDQDGRLIIGTWGGGVQRFDPQSEEFTLLIDTSEPIYTLAYHSEYGLYAGSWGGGLYHFDPLDNSITHYRHDAMRKESLAHNIVYSLHIDNYGIVWIGTNGNGISKLNVHQNNFLLVDSQGTSSERIESARVRSLQELDNGEILIGFQNAGIDRYNMTTGEIHRYRSEFQDGLGDNTINDFLKLKNGTVLVATNNGIYAYSYRESSFEHVDYNPDPKGGVNENIIYSLAEQADGSLWIGTYNRGVIQRSPGGELQRYEHKPDQAGSLSNNLVYQVFVDSRDNVWIATNMGLNLYDPDTNTFQHYLYDSSDITTISSNSVSIVYEDSRGLLWIGTRSGGLNLFSRETGTVIRHFTNNRELQSNSIMAINECPDELMYIATSNGLHSINPLDYSVNLISEADGLPIREFSGSSIKLQNGSLIFGSFGTIIQITENVVPVEVKAPYTIITDILIQNESLRGMNSNRIGDLSLKHSENRLGFRFASSDFTLPERNTYEVYLSGIDDSWQALGNREFVEYVNLSPGNYTFRVRAANSYGIYNEIARDIQIRIAPPFWQTTIFRTALLFMLLGSVVLFHYMNTNRLRKQNVQLDEQVQKRTIELIRVNEDLSTSQEEKDRFFHILAHDLRGPIAGLKSFSEGLIDVRDNLSPDDVTEALSTIFETSSGISKLLERLLEWGNLQRSREPLVFQQVLLSELLEETCTGFASMLESKGIKLEHEINQDLYCTTDPQILASIIHNLVHNAIKFCNSGDSINIAADLTEQSVLDLSVCDTGIGIPEDKLSDILLLDKFESTRGTAGEKGTGLGLPLVKQQAEMLGGSLKISSVEGEGTQITIRIPMQED